MTSGATGRRPPGPRGADIVRALLNFKRRRVLAFEDLARTYGEVSSFHCLGFKLYLVTGAEPVRHVMVTNADNYVKSPGGRRAQRFFGQSLQTTPGAAAKPRRQMLATMLQRDRVRPFADVAVSATRAMLDGWTAGEVRVCDAVMDLTLDIGIQMHFGIGPREDSRRIRDPFTDALRRLDGFLQLPPPFPTRGNRAYARAMAAYDAEILPYIAKRRAEGGPRHDLLSSMLETRQSDGQVLTDRQICHELTSTLAASFFTTAAAFIQVLRLVAQHPQVEAQLAAELEGALQGRPPGFADLDRLPFTAQIVKETLRLCPPAGAMVRVAVDDDRIGEWHVPGGARVIISQWVMQHKPEWFPDPEAFKPERWTPGFERELPTFAYFPFGWGARNCIGQPLAMLQLQLMLATVAQCVRIEPVRPTPAAFTIDDILESGGLVLRVHPRTA